MKGNEKGKAPDRVCVDLETDTHISGLNLQLAVFFFNFEQINNRLNFGRNIRL